MAASKGGAGTATFPIKVEDQTSGAAKAAASSLELFRAQIESSEQAIKEMSGAQRRLKGDTEELKTAREQLIAKINAERNAVTQANLALLKQGTTYDKLATDSRKLAKEKDELKKKTDADGLKESKERLDNVNGAISKAGGPLASLRDRFSSLKDVATGAGGGMAIASLAIAGTIAVAAKLATGLADLTSNFVKFVFASSNVLRSQGLMREAVLDSAEQAKNFGTQIDELSRNLATPKEKLNELAVGLSRTRLTGEEMVDTFKAVASASEAMGDDVGNTFKDIITRGAQMQHLQINPQELMGKGVEFNDVAAALAKNLHIGIEDAKKELFEGRAKLSDGAKAIKDAVDKRFGAVNAKKMLDLNVIEQKFGEGLANLTRDVNIEPLSRGFKTLFSVFDEGTVTGATLKTFITDFGNKFASTFERLAPIGVGFFEGLVVSGLKLELAYVKLEKAFDKAFGGGTTDIDAVSAASGLASNAFNFLVDTIDAVTWAIDKAHEWAKPFVELYHAIDDGTTKLASYDWGALGAGLIDGFAAGLKSRIPVIGEMLGAVTDDIKRQFKNALGIHSPSTVFAEFGQNTADGYTQGVESGTSRAQQAVYEMGSGSPALPSGDGASRGGASRAPITLNLTIHVGGGADGDNAAKKLSDSSFLATLTKTIEDAIAGAEVSPA